MTLRFLNLTVSVQHFGVRGRGVLPVAGGGRGGLTIESVWDRWTVPPKLMANARTAGRSYGKSDPIDALALARAALREPELPVARLDGPAREIRLLVDHHRRPGRRADPGHQSAALAPP